MAACMSPDDRSDAVTHRIPAGRGLAIQLRAGELARIVNPTGTQVVDMWAVASDAVGEFLSMEHCREVLERIYFEVGDVLLTNRYRPVLTIVEDTSPGRHDTLIAACSTQMYERVGTAGHRNCADNFAAALESAGVPPFPFVPSPWNLFMSAPVTEAGTISYERPSSRPGDHVEVRAELDCTLICSACPDDHYPTNGGDGTPTDAQIVTLATP
jgi:uncharacterized protein YcgI (DUF1989 family)